jgi:hypothetical protein
MEQSRVRPFERSGPLGLSKPAPRSESFLAPHVIDGMSGYRQQFLTADPYKHVVIDNFLAPDFAEAVLRDFPAFNPALARNEIYEGVWGKSVNTRIREISPAYEELYAFIGSPAFLSLMSELTGIPDLLLDSTLYGGGTHDNLNGQSLDAHVDFNYDEAQKLHRRLNLIVYLNKDWRPEWGGSLELHSNPRRPKENRITSYLCGFNRAVVFETNEYSWHGFPEIDLPVSLRHRSRKSISIYLYTKDRPAYEIAPAHGTFYVHRPLPSRFVPGYTLTEADLTLLHFDVDRRDRWIEIYQNMELAKSAEISGKASYIHELLRRVHAPITGYVLQKGESSGLYPEGWASGQVQLRIQPQEPVKKFVLKGWRPESAPVPATITVQTDEQPIAIVQVGHGVFEIPVLFDPARVQEYVLTVHCDIEFQAPADSRQLSYVLMELRHEH